MLFDLNEVLFDIDEVVSLLDSSEELTPKTSQIDAHFLFDWASTTYALKAYNPSLKISYAAKETFASAISSFADEIMERILETRRCTHININDILEAFEHLNEPLGSFPLADGYDVSLSLRRILLKYRSLYKFKFQQQAQKAFASILSSFMIDLAMQIHLHRASGRILSATDISNITDTIIVRRTYTRKRAISRSVHASRRTRKADGKF